MYSFGWLSLVCISLSISLFAFIWGLKNGQFSDQARVRYFPLRDQIEPAPACSPAKISAEVFALLGIFIYGLLVMLAPVVLTLIH